MAGIRNQRGFTVAELLIAVAVTGLIMGGLIVLLTGSQQSYLQGVGHVEAQQSGRVVLAGMIQEIRGAGYNPTNAAFAAVTAQSATGFTLQNDWNGNGVIEVGVTVTVGGLTRGEQVTYSLTGNTVRRQESDVDAGPQTIGSSSSSRSSTSTPPALPRAQRRTSEPSSSRSGCALTTSRRRRTGRRS